HLAMTRLQVGHFILHYSKGALRAVGEVRSSAQPASRPSELPEAAWQTDGYRAAIDYQPLNPPILIETIPEARRRAEAPFDKYGGVKQGYLFPLSREFRDWFLQVYGGQIPQLDGRRPSDADPQEQRPAEVRLPVHPQPYTLQDALGELFLTEQDVVDTLELLR